MDPQVLGSLIDAGAEAVSGLGNLLTFGGSQHYQRKMMRYQAGLNRQMMAEQNSFNRAAMERQFEQNKEIWRMNNEYNDPSAQRARLESAGYNPYSLVGNTGISGNAQTVSGGSFSGVSVSPVQQSDVQFPRMDFLAKSVQNYFSTKMLQEQTRGVSADATMKEMDTEYRRLRNMEEINQIRADTKEKLAKHDLNEKEREMLSVRLSLLDGQLNALIEQPYLENEQTRKQILAIDAQEEYVREQAATERVRQQLERANIRVAERTYDKIGAEMAAYYAQVENLLAQRDLSRAQLETELKRAETEFYKGLRERLHYGTESQTQDLIIRQLEEDINKTHADAVNSYENARWTGTRAVSGALGVLGVGSAIGSAGRSLKKIRSSSSEGYQNWHSNNTGY